MTITQDIAVRGGVLVGHDGSAGATSALRTAVSCAEAFGPHVEVVRAWTLVTAPGLPDGRPSRVPSYEEFEAASLAALERDVAPVRADHPDVPISCSVVHGDAAEKLVDASAHVDLLVVGGHQHGGIVGLLLNAVADEVVRHASCRVLVDRGTAPARQRPGV